MTDVRREFDDEEFSSIAYSYRAWPMTDSEGVVARYNELVAYVQELIAAGQAAAEETLRDYNSAGDILAEITGCYDQNIALWELADRVREMCGQLKRQNKKLQQSLAYAESQASEYRARYDAQTNGLRRVMAELAEAQKDAQRWREFCASVKQALAGGFGYAPLWGEDERLFANIISQRRGEGQVKVELWYDAPNEIINDLDAAISALTGADKNGPEPAQLEDVNHAVPSKERSGDDNLPDAMGRPNRVAEG